MLINIAQIRVDERIRDRETLKGEGWSEFKGSFLKHGQLQPVVVSDNGDGSYDLVAGERRLLIVSEIYADGKLLPELGATLPGESQAMMAQGCIKAEVRGKLTEETSLTLEFEENERRKSFTWEEKAKYIRKIHDMYAAKYKESWNQEMTAEILNISTGAISNYLNLGKAMEEHPEVAKASTIKSAIKRAKAANQLKFRKIEVKKDDTARVTRAETLITLGDACEWIKTLADSSVDLVNFDPPWGEEASYKVAENWEAFADDTNTSTELAERLLPEILRVLKPNRFCIFWYRQHIYESTVETCEGFGFSLKGSRTPCIWYKPEKDTDQNRFPEKILIDGYENFLLLRKGDPVFYDREHKTNVFTFTRVPRGAKVHPTEKPLDLMTQLIRMMTVPGEVVMDPTAGSGSALIAAYQALRKPLGCELSKNFHSQIVLRLTKILTGE